MSDRFDPTHELASKQDAAVAAMAGVRNEVITGGGPRRRWSSDDKARIVRESMKPGAVVSEVAQRHGLTRWQLYEWRRKARAATAVPDDQTEPPRRKRKGLMSKAAEVLPSFAPVVMAMPATQPTACEVGLMEIAIGSVSVRIRGMVDVEGLVAVLNAIRRVS
jgi:transposase